MAEAIKLPLKDVERTEDDEDSVLEDDEDDPSGSFIQKLYSYYSFPEEEPICVRFKGKKPIFVKSVETLNDLLKRGEGSCVNNVTFKVLDVRTMPYGMEYDVQSTKDKERGVSVLKIYGPNQKKGCTIMICKSREYEKKFVSILGNDIVKHFLDNFEATDGWKTLLEKASFKKPSCQMCKKTFCNEKNLRTHMKKYHTNIKVIKCEFCGISSEDENNLKTHIETHHKKPTVIKCDVCDFTSQMDDEVKVHMETYHAPLLCAICNSTFSDDNVLRDHMDSHNMEVELSEDLEKKVEVLEGKIVKMVSEHDNKVKELLKNNEEKENFYQTNLKRMQREETRKNNEIQKLKEENIKILEKLGQLQWEKDIMDAELKAKEKRKKMEENLILFNELIGKKADDDKSEMRKKYDEKELNMEECDGGFSYEMTELLSLQQNKQKGFQRTTPQASPELVRRIEKCEEKILHCPQCDFITPSETFFNEHMKKIHTGPNCPFCFIPFDEYAALRKHCAETHSEFNDDKTQNKETLHNKSKKSENWKSKKPCRFFRNGEGNCIPRNGLECEFSHSVIPFSERQECHHKQSCKFKPYCIFFHPEGQKVENWQKNTKNVLKICYYNQQGLACIRSVCSFYHPLVRNQQGFQWDHLKKPPIMTNPTLIMKNKNPLNKLSQSLKGLDLD